MSTNGAPATITLTSGDSNITGYTDFTITVPSSSWISFNWVYDTSDFWPELDNFGYLVNGLFTSLLSVGDIPPLTHQSGHATLLLGGGDEFGFRADTFDGYGGAAVMSITHFTVPEPSSLALFGVGLAGLRSQRRRSA